MYIHIFFFTSKLFLFFLGNLFSTLGSTVFTWYFPSTSMSEWIDPSSILKYVGNLFYPLYCYTSSMLTQLNLASFF